MEKSAILKADLLDIIFDGRNKDYGAYELRRTYNHRLRISITVMLLLASMLCIGHLVAGKFTAKEDKLMEVKDQVLSQVDLPEEAVLPPPPVEPPPPQQQVRTIQFTKPLIVQEEVIEDVMPPAEELDKNVQIDIATKDGEDFTTTIAPPPADNGRGILEAPKPVDDPNAVHIKVEIDAEYPGGNAAWQRFLTKNLRIPQVMIDNEMNASVMVQFVVDKDGNVSDVEFLSGPAEMKEEAMRVIRKSGKWTPAIQNGMHVKARKKQPIIIKIVQE